MKIVEILHAGADTRADTDAEAERLRREWPESRFGVIARPPILELNPGRGSVTDTLPRSTSPWVIVERRPVRS